MALLWREDNRLFGRFLSPREQWDLHDFYALSDDLPPLVALANREQAVALDPSLPQRAGRALKKLLGECARLKKAGVLVPAAGSGKRSKGKPVVASATVWPRADIDRLSQALMKAMEDLDHNESR